MERENDSSLKLSRRDALIALRDLFAVGGGSLLLMRLMGAGVELPPVATYSVSELTDPKKQQELLRYVGVNVQEVITRGLIESPMIIYGQDRSAAESFALAPNNPALGLLFGRVLSSEDEYQFKLVDPQDNAKFLTAFSTNLNFASIPLGEAVEVFGRFTTRGNSNSIRFYATEVQMLD